MICSECYEDEKDKIIDKHNKNIFRCPVENCGSIIDEIKFEKYSLQWPDVKKENPTRLEHIKKIYFCENAFEKYRKNYLTDSDIDTSNAIRNEYIYKCKFDGCQRSFTTISDRNSHENAHEDSYRQYRAEFHN